MLGCGGGQQGRILGFGIDGGGPDAGEIGMAVGGTRRRAVHGARRRGRPDPSSRGSGPEVSYTRSGGCPPDRAISRDGTGKSSPCSTRRELGKLSDKGGRAEPFVVIGCPCGVTGLRLRVGLRGRREGCRQRATRGT